MSKKIILVIILFNFVTHCGFTPLYSNLKNVNFSIVSIDFQGDRLTNNFLKNELVKYQNEKYEKKFKIKVETSYEKIDILKDKTANISKYELSVDAVIQIISNEKIIKELKIKEKKIIDNIDDDFEEQKNERVAKQNFASSISNKLLTELSILNDN